MRNVPTKQEAASIHLNARAARAHGAVRGRFGRDTRKLPPSEPDVIIHVIHLAPARRRDFLPIQTALGCRSPVLPAYWVVQTCWRTWGKRSMAKSRGSQLDGEGLCQGRRDGGASARARVAGRGRGRRRRQAGRLAAFTCVGAGAPGAGTVPIQNASSPVATASSPRQLAAQPLRHRHHPQHTTDHQQLSTPKQPLRRLTTHPQP